jgi:hypothetical protein
MWRASSDALGDHMWRQVEGEYLKRTAKNALVESFTIHTRALMDFLYVGNPRDTDVVVTDFFTEEEWRRMSAAPEPDPPWRTPSNVRSNKEHPVLVEARRRTSKEIAHLTYNRLDRIGDDKLWPTAEIVDALSTDLGRFVDQVPAERVVDGFKAIYVAIGARPSESHKGRTEPGASVTTASAATAALGPREETA